MKKANAQTESSEVSAKPLSAEAPTTEALLPIEPQPITPAEIEELRARAAKADEVWERLLRTTADFDNFKKRAARERQDAARFANEGLIQKLIPVLDNFEMALTAAQSGSAADSKSLSAGVAMIHSQLRQALTDAGLEELIATDQVFDPNLHEAVSQQESFYVWASPERKRPAFRPSCVLLLE